MLMIVTLLMAYMIYHEQIFLPRDVDDEDRRKSHYDSIIHSSMSAVDSNYNKYIFICSHKKGDVQMGVKSLQELLNILTTS